MFVPINGAPNLPNPNETPTKIPVRPKTDIWRKPPSINTFNAPCYIAHMPAESFLRARVSVKGDWKRLYDQGGLVLFLPGWPGQEVWIKAGVEFNDGRPWVSTVAGRDGGDWSLYPAPNGGGGQVTVEIEREDEGKDTSLWVYLVEGERRTALREVTWVFKEDHLGGNISVGIYAARPTQLSDGDNEELSVEFSALQVWQKHA